MTLDSATGALAGTLPATAATYTFTVQVTDATSTQATSGGCTINSLTTAVPDSFAALQPGFVQSLVGATQLGADWSGFATVLDGCIYATQGRFVDPGSAGTRYDDGTETTQDSIVRICSATGGGFAPAVGVTATVKPPVVLSCPTNIGQVGFLDRSSLVAAGGVSQYTYSIIAGSLPPGLGLVASTGAISGTPTVAGPFPFTAQVVDFGNNVVGTTTSSCGITTAPSSKIPALTLTKTANPASYAYAGQIIAYSYVVQDTGNVPLTEPFPVIDDKLGPLQCGSAATSLASGASVTCTATDVIQASDLGNVPTLPTKVIANVNTGAWLQGVMGTAPGSIQESIIELKPLQTITNHATATVSLNGVIVQSSAQAVVTQVLVLAPIDAQISADQPSAKNVVATGKFSTAAVNELLLAFIAADNVTAARTTVTNVSGAGLSWQLVVRANAQRGTAEIWRAFAPGLLSNVSITASLSQAVASSLTVLSLPGVDASGTNGSGAIGATAIGAAGTGAPTATLTTTRNNSLIFGVGDDWDSAIARVPGLNQAVIHQYMPPVADTYWVQRLIGSVAISGTAISPNDPSPATDRWNLAAVEILSADH
jgi:hypothetical protein